MSTTYRAKFIIAALFAAAAIYAVLNESAGLAAFAGLAAGTLTMDGIWSGWWKAWKYLNVNPEDK